MIGDLQRTVLAEQLYLGRRQNDAVREALMKAIERENPGVLLLLGDQVADGASDREWRYFDAMTSNLRDAGTAFHALLGNHDYSTFDRARSELHFNSRFGGEHPDEPQCLRFGDVAYVGVDSNFDILGVERARRQAAQYSALLEDLERDDDVRGIIVASHHPPYSNSRIRNNAAIVSAFAEPFLAAQKTRLYLSAHVHSYERFEVGGKMFVVSGGGGGPRRSIDVSDGRRWTHDAFQGEKMRPFHYLRMHITLDAIKVETMMLAETMRRWQRRWRGDPPEVVMGDAFELEL